MAVFVTDGNQRATFALVRALGAAGIPVTVGEASQTSLAGSSRHCRRTVRYPSPADDGEQFVNFLRGVLQGGGHEVLIPMTDITMQIISAERDSFQPMVRLPFPDRANVELVQDKREVLLRALQLGIACPETSVLREGERVEDVARSARFPVVLKPRYSRYYRDGGWTEGSVQFTHTPEALISAYHRMHAEIPYPLVQEKLEGEGRGVFLLVWDGELKAAFCHRRLREKPPWGGVSVYCESVPLDENLVGQSLALLRAVGWQGVAMVEYKVDRRDGQPKLMEVNGRFWGSLQLAVDAGMNFPLLLYRLATGENPPAQHDYKVGVKSRWLLGDLDCLWIRFKHPRMLNGSALPGPSRFRAVLDFLKFYERDLHYEILRLDDPAPGWHEIKTYLRDGLRRDKSIPEEAGAR